jgi:predicted nucleic acid-binding protein
VIVIDTSAWVSAIRNPGSRDDLTLRGLIDADEAGLALPVRIELLASTKTRHRQQLRAALTALPVVFPTDETWATIEGWVETAAHQGEHFSVNDLLIAALADEVGALVWSLDQDFERMEKLKFVRLM